MSDTGLQVAKRVQLLAEMQEMGVFMMRQKLARRNPNATEEQLKKMLSDWLGGRAQPRDVGGCLEVSRNPRFVGKP